MTGAPRRWWLGLLLGVVALLAVVSAVLWWGVYRDAPRPEAAEVQVEIPGGASLISTARTLTEAGLLEHPWQLRAAALLEGGAREIKAGRYRLRPGSSAASILRTLVAGRIETVALTLVEGWPAGRVVSVVADSLSLDRAVLDSLVRDPLPRWRQRLGLPGDHGLEGYLFPETYRFAEGLSPESVLETMFSTLESVLVDSVRARLAALDWSLHQLLTFSSIVEAEATRDDERTRVAAVYHNRLRKGWKLEADPTVAYAVGKIGERLYFRDLEVDSPYNTYRYEGLPPGPINNPGRASVLASLWPQPGFDAMYFVADGSGGHVFSRTWEEHRRAVERYRRLMRERRGP